MTHPPPLAYSAPAISSPSRNFLQTGWSRIKRRVVGCVAWCLFGRDPVQTVVDLGLAEDCREEED